MARLGPFDAVRRSNFAIFPALSPLDPRPIDFVPCVLERFPRPWTAYSAFLRKFRPARFFLLLDATDPVEPLPGPMPIRLVPVPMLGCFQRLPGWFAIKA